MNMTDKRTIIPKKQTQVFGRTLRIENKEIKDIGNRTLYGTINLKTGVITLRKSTTKDIINFDELEITYIHELLHFILNKTGYEVKLDKANIDLEEIIETIAIGIYDALKNSK